MTVPSYLEIKGLNKSFDGEQIIKDLDCNVDQGKILAILGSSGCGKSTTLRIIAGLLKQDSGEIWMDDEHIDRIPINRRGIGFVFQNYSLFPHLTVQRNIEFGLRLRKVNPASRDRKVKELLDLVGLKGMQNRRPSQLSGGQQQRVALARALAIEPKMLLLDEPFGALDAKIRRRIRRDLKELQRDLGITTIFVTHDQEEAFEIGDLVGVMNMGVLEQVDLPRNLYDCPKSKFVAKFVGNVNVIKLPETKDEAEMEVMVRPEDIELERYIEGMQCGICGTLANYVFLGPYIEAVVALDNKESLHSILPKSEFNKKGYRRGDRLRVKILRFKSFSN